MTAKKKVAKKKVAKKKVAKGASSKTTWHYHSDVTAAFAKEFLLFEEVNLEREDVDVIPNIRQHYRQGNLVFVLGAGLSLDSGLPDWNTLLQRLLLSTIKTGKAETPGEADLLARLFAKVFTPDPLIAARYLSGHYRKENPKDPLAFVKAIRDALYRTEMDNNSSELLKEVTKFCTAAGKSPNLDCIITYNYDDVIERRLSELELGIPYSVTV